MATNSADICEEIRTRLANNLPSMLEANSLDDFIEYYYGPFEMIVRPLVKLPLLTVHVDSWEQQPIDLMWNLQRTARVAIWYGRTNEDLSALAQEVHIVGDLICRCIEGYEPVGPNVYLVVTSCEFSPPTIKESMICQFGRVSVEYEYGRAPAS